MPVVFQDHDDHLCFGIEDQRNKLDHLPPGVYKLKLHKTADGVGIKLYKSVKSFPLPERRFGRHESIAKTVIADYDIVNPPLGLMAIGKKGSGKSMLCEDLCNRFLAKGMPVIMIDEPVPHDILSLFTRAIGPSVFYFDEIGKVYPGKGDDEDSNTGLNQLLPFFSNQTLTGRVFLITANSTSELNEFFLDRPGRFKYRISMDRMERVAYLEYMKAQNVPLGRMIWMEGTWVEYTFDQLRVVVPILKQATDLQDFLDQISILNVHRMLVTVLNIYDLSKNGVPVQIETAGDVSLSLDNSDLIITLPDDTIRFQWRTDIGTFNELFHGNPNLMETTLEVGDYTLNLGMDREWFIPRFEDLLPGTLVRKRPRLKISYKPKKSESQEVKSKDVAVDIGRGRMLNITRQSGESVDVEVS
jgi:ATPase family associated with various cellular activities (AAA)